MRVRVLYFGVLRERFRCSDEVLELADGVAVGELILVLRGRASNDSMGRIAQSGLDERLWRSLAVAVNREYSSHEVVLRDGDEVALLPPVSGGSCADRDKLLSLASLRGIVFPGANNRMRCAQDRHAD